MTNNDMSTIEKILDEDNIDNIFLYDDENNEIEFEQVAVIPLNDEVYVILSPVKELGGVRELCYDAAVGSVECTVTLPAFLLGKEKVWFRIFPSSTKLTVLPENPADDINSGTMQAGFSHQFALRLGKVSVKALK